RIALNLHLHRLAGAKSRLEHHLFPVRMGDAVDIRNHVTRLYTGFGGRTAFLHPSHSRGIVKIRGLLKVKNVQARQQYDREGNVHEWPSNRDEETMPAGMRHELARI